MTVKKKTKLPLLKLNELKLMVPYKYVKQPKATSELQLLEAIAVWDDPNHAGKENKVVGRLRINTDAFFVVQHMSDMVTKDTGSLFNVAKIIGATKEVLGYLTLLRDRGPSEYCEDDNDRWVTPLLFQEVVDDE